MKLLFDFFPILLFFIAFKFFGIYVATGVAMAGAFLQNCFFYYQHRRFEMMHVATLIIILVLGAATFLLHDPLFIQWKPTVVYWMFALLFLLTHRFTKSKKTLIQRLMEANIELPENIWAKLNTSWIIFFIFMGILNLLVMHYFSLNTWVDFKLFGTLALILIFGVFQGAYILKHVQRSPLNK